MNAYRVEVEAGGCDHCGKGRLWTVVGPDDVAWGISWGSEEDARDWCDAMNAAYDEGRKVAEGSR